MNEHPVDMPRNRLWLLPVVPIKKALKPHYLVLSELRNKLFLWPKALRLRKVEDAEVSRLSAGLANMPEARVAVIITTYKRPELLIRAIRTGLAQTIEDIVVLVVDDGGGLPDLGGLAADKRLFTCSLSANIGTPSIGRNVGIRLTKSKYVAFLDDDNMWEPEHLATALRALEGGGPGSPPGCVYTGVVRVLPDGRVHDVLSVDFDRRLMGSSSFIDTNSMVIRRFPRLHWSRIRRTRGMVPIEDWELAHRLSRSMKIQHVNVPTVRYLINSDSYYTNWSASRNVTEDARG